MRQALTLPDALVSELKSRAGKLGITPSRLAEVFLARGLRSSEPVVLEADQSRSYAVLLTGSPMQTCHPATPPIDTSAVTPVINPRGVPGYDPEVGF